MYAEGFWLFALMLFLLKKKKELKQKFWIATAQTGCYMNRHKTGNPQNLRLYAESKGNTLRVAGSGWSSPVCVIETARMRRGCRTKLCLETQLWCAAGLSWGRWGRDTRSAACLPEQKVTVSPLCFTGWEDLFCPCGQTCWAVVLLLRCVSGWDRCLVQGALRSLMCLGASRALLMCQGRNLPFRASLLWCHSVLLPMWSYPLKTQEYLSLNICLKSTDTSFPVWICVNERERLWAKML